MFCDHLQENGKAALYNIGAEKEDFPYWIALWWQEPVHFRLAERTMFEDVAARDSDTYRCFWSDEALPAMLVDEYRACNRLSN